MKRRRRSLMGELTHRAAKQRVSEASADASLAALVLDKHNRNDLGSRLGLMVAIREAVRGGNGKK